MKAIKEKAGFTLVEVLVVVAIIGIMATLMIISYNSSLKKSRDSRRLADAESIKLACVMYADKNNAYPAGTVDSNAWGTLQTALLPYIDLSKIDDPLPSDYAYSYAPDIDKGCVITYYSEISKADKTVYCSE